MKRAVLALLSGAAILVGAALISSPARAAAPGVGFGAWAPTSAYGWHGSMLVDDVHTYCILPGHPVPTGESHDHGVVTAAAGLDPQRLTAINMLVSTYGQTDDPVQAASVGWAVKAIADWDETLHSFGYRGDSLQGAVHWIFSALAPEHDQAVQDLAAAYYAEAMAMPAGPASGSGRLEFTTRADDASRGTVTVRADVPDVRGTITLENAVFADTGSPSLDDAAPGASYEIIGAPPAGATSYTVAGSGVLRGGFLPAVRYVTTAGGQDTAGPGGRLEIPVSGADAAPRDTVFAPQITTQVVSRYLTGGPFVDDVAFTNVRGTWPRTADGGYASVTATATVYRTRAEPRLADEVPTDAEPVGELALTTDRTAGPAVPYRVESDWSMPGPGFYTAVWRIEADEQNDRTRAALDDRYSWTEQFGEAGQVVLVAAVSSEAEAEVALGGTLSDVVIVEGPVPADGLDVSSTVFRVPDDVAPAEACTAENLLWQSAPVRVSAPGAVSFTAPEVPDFGAYVWRERATDAAGERVHEGACGVEAETTRAPRPSVTTRAPASAGLGGEIADTAMVSGRLPVGGATELRFEVYRSDDGDPSAACRPENLAATTPGVPVRSAGEVASPAVRLHESGTYFWVESLWWTPVDEAPRLLAQGECGHPEETTIVAQPTLVTAADERAAVGVPYGDTAVIAGLGEGVQAELVFSVYRTSDEAPVCTPETLEAVTEAVAVTGSGEYRSPEIASASSGVRQWVAELRYRPAPDAEPVVLLAGECGAAGELTRVDLLAVTGPDAATTVRLVAGCGLGAVVLGGVFALWARRRAGAIRRRAGLLAR